MVGCSCSMPTARLRLCQGRGLVCTGKLAPMRFQFNRIAEHDASAQQPTSCCPEGLTLLCCPVLHGWSGKTPCVTALSINLSCSTADLVSARLEQVT